MMFICLTLLLEHRDRLMKRGADFNDIAIYFDKLARQHSAPKVPSNMPQLLLAFGPAK